MASETKQHVPSPGEAFSLGIHGMRMPHLEFMYRIVCQMAVKYTTIPAVPKTNISRLVLPIAGGTVSGPRITGIIVPNSGADWAQVVGDELKQFTRLDARYTLETNDGHHILVNAKGVFQQGPNSDPRVNTNPTVTQDDAEYFTHLSFEASSTGPYGWMNSLVAIGVMTMFEDQPIIDCYRLTNFPCVEPGQL